MPLIASEDFSAFVLYDPIQNNPAWVLHSASNNPSVVVPYGDVRAAKVLASGSNTSLYYRAAVPADANQSVQAVLGSEPIGGDAGLEWWLAARVNTAVNTCYLGGWSNGQWQIVRVVNGVRTVLGQFAQSLASASFGARTVRLLAVGSSLTLFVDNEPVVGPVTDSSITAAGRVGFQLGHSALVAYAWSASDGQSAGAAGPSITQQPQSVTVAPGANATFNVTATGTGTLLYQWRFNGSAVGTNSSSYTRPNVSSTDTGGQVVVTVSDSNGSINSSAATLTVTTGADTQPPSLTGQITIGTVTGSSIAISWPQGTDNVAVVGYDVSRDGGATWTSAGTALSFNFTGLAASTSYQLRVRARDAAGNVSSPALSAVQSTSAAPPPTGSFSVTFGPFAAQATGSGVRASGESFDWWAFSNVAIGGNIETAIRQRGSGTLNSSGLAVITGLQAAGSWEVQVRFPNDPGSAAEKGTARATLTAA